MSYIDQIFGTEQVQKPSGHKVLLVDDESALRELMGIRLQNVGFDVEEAANGYEALEKVIHGKYDALILDINMPGMLGYEVCSAVREYSFGKYLAILTVSANANNPFYKQKCTEAEADILLDKAEVINFPELLERNIYSKVAFRKGI